MTEQACPCQSSKAYSDCCQPLHQGQPAASATALMRSRYCAFCLGLVDYLIDTLAMEMRQPDDRQQLQQSIDNTQWLGLQILNTKQLSETEAIVEFVAWYQQTPPGQLHEQSRFVQRQQRWYYLDGEMLKPIKPERNSACFCGSGQKYKRCHGRG